MSHQTGRSACICVQELVTSLGHACFLLLASPWLVCWDVILGARWLSTTSTSSDCSCIAGARGVSSVKAIKRNSLSTWYAWAGQTRQKTYRQTYCFHNGLPNVRCLPILCYFRLLDSRKERKVKCPQCWQSLAYKFDSAWALSSMTFWLWHLSFYDLFSCHNVVFFVFVCIYIYIHRYLSIYQSIRRSIYQIYQTINISTRQSINQSIHLPLHLFIFLQI